MQSNGMFDYDLSQAPLVRIRYPAEASVAAIESAFELFVQLSHEHGRVAYVFDMTLLNPLTMSAKMRRAFADCYAANRSVVEPATVCEALVVSSQLVRGLVTAVNWLTNRDYPQRNFTEMDRAVRWARTMLARPTAMSM